MTSDLPPDVRFESADEALAWLRTKAGLHEDAPRTPKQMYGAAAKVVHAESPGRWSGDMDWLEAAYEALKREDMWS